MLSNSVFFAVLAMLLWGVAPLFGKLALGTVEPVAALMIRSGLVALVLLIFVVIAGKWPEVVSARPRDIVFIALEGLCAGLVGGLAYYYALKYGEVSKVVPTVAAFPLIAIFLGIFVLGEKVTWGKILGGMLIVLGIALVNYR